MQTFHTGQAIQHMQCAWIVLQENGVMFRTEAWLDNSFGSGMNGVVAVR